MTSAHAPHYISQMLKITITNIIIIIARTGNVRIVRHVRAGGYNHPPTLSIIVEGKEHLVVKYTNVW